LARRSRRGETEGAGTDALAVSPKSTVGKPIDYRFGPIGSIITRLQGGKASFMALAELAPQIEPELAVIIEDWQKLSTHGKRVTKVEDLCAARQIDPFHFLAVVNEAAMKFRDNALLLIASMNAPILLEKSAQYGMQKDGFKDRQAILQHAGIFPSPQGTRINILNQNSAKAASQSEANVDRGLPTFERSISEMEDE
jgi:hypothetical protein